MKKEIKNVPASIRSRLRNKAREMGVPFAEILQYFCMERFLYRFGKSKYANKFILKGALMFTAWQIPERRTTLDIDLLAYFDNKIAGIEHFLCEPVEAANKKESFSKNWIAAKSWE